MCTPAASYKVSSCVETQTWRVPAVNRGDVVRAAGRIHNSEKCLKPSLFIYFLGCIICTKASIHMPGIKFQRKALRANVQHSRANRCSPGTPTTTEERSEICPPHPNKKYMTEEKCVRPRLATRCQAASKPRPGESQLSIGATSCVPPGAFIIAKSVLSLLFLFIF